MIRLFVRMVDDTLTLTLPKGVVARLEVGDGDSIVLIERPEGGYFVTADRSDFQARIDMAEKIMGRYRNTLRVLAS